MRAALGAVAQTLGEIVRIEPVIQSEYADDAPDPERASKDALGVVSLTPTVEDTDGAKRGGKMSTATRLSLREGSVWFTPDAYAAIGYPLREGDRIILRERPEEQPYRVSSAPITSDRGDVAVTLVVDGSR